MARPKTEKNENVEKVFLAQRELAERWRMSETAISDMRKRGELPFFVPPGSSRIFYPKDQIIKIEDERTTFIAPNNTARVSKLKIVEESVDPTSPEKAWRI